MKELVLEICTEMNRAIRFGSPLFFIVYYEQETHKIEFLQLLQKELVNKGLNTRTFDPVHRPEHGTGRMLSQLSASSKKNELSLLTDLPRLKDSTQLERNFLAYLNLHRDEIFKSGLRLILFLHQTNAEQFIDTAGDLWDFRHRSYWLERKTTLIEKHLEEVHDLVDKTVNKEEKAELLLDLTRWLLRRDSAPLAVETAIEGIAIIAKSKTKIRADLEHELAYALKLTSDFPGSLEHYQQGLAVSREIGDREGESAALNSISGIYRSLGRIDKAVNHLKKAIEIEESIAHPKLAEHKIHLEELENRKRNTAYQNEKPV